MMIIFMTDSWKIRDDPYWISRKNGMELVDQDMY
jgi:hypothetical protein